MSGIEKSVRTVLHGRVGRRHGLIGSQNGKIGQAFALCLFDGKTGRRRCRLKTDRQKDNLLLRMFSGIGHCILGGIDHLDPGAGRTRRGKAADLCSLFFRCRRRSPEGPGHTNEVSECTDGHIALHGKIDRLINEIHRCHADRTSGS